jgi:hypothetical protein
MEAGEQNDKIEEKYAKPFEMAPRAGIEPATN